MNTVTAFVANVFSDYMLMECHGRFVSSLTTIAYMLLRMICCYMVVQKFLRRELLAASKAHEFCFSMSQHVLPSIRQLTEAPVAFSMLVEVTLQF